MAHTPAVRERYEPVIGLEVHVQLLTSSKIFCACPTNFGAPPNTNVCPVCLGLPGALPVLNRKCVELAVLAARALNCTVNETSVFARKNYFYPDLPKGYQISQYDKPLAEHGWIELAGSKRIGITRLHIEEDAGKSLHDGFADSDSRSYIDLNRSGVPLIEIVSEPDMRSPEEAYEYLTLLKEILFTTGVSDVSMEEGSLRCDANVSVRPAGASTFGTKTEVKNVNSFRFIKQALAFEIERHISVVEGGDAVVHETRSYDAGAGETFPMRSKEQAHDYRYFPEPDLAPLTVSREWQDAVRQKMPELPQAKRARFVRDYGITEKDAHALTTSAAVAEAYETVARTAKNPKRIANLVITELSGRLNAAGLSFERSPISMGGVVMSADLAESGDISSKMLKDLYDKAFASGEDFPIVYEREKPQQITDTAELERVIEEVVAANPSQLAQYRAGKKTVITYFVGKVMQATRGKANPALANELLARKLEG